MSEHAAFIALIIAIPIAATFAFASGYSFGRAAELRRKINKDWTRNG